jgi:hypothetical protein
VGTRGRGAAWQRLPLAGDTPLRLHDEGAPGIRRIVLAGPAAGGFSIGDVRFEFAAP